eukprot:5231312-Amphidinium_carterae.1
MVLGWAIGAMCWMPGFMHSSSTCSSVDSHEPGCSNVPLCATCCHHMRAESCESKQYAVRFLRGDRISDYLDYSGIHASTRDNIAMVVTK